MFDIGASEMLMIVIVAVVVIGPKDMPTAMRTAGRWIGKMRRVSGHFRAGIDTMVREAELEEMERKWREQNEAIMKAHPQLPTADEMAPLTNPSDHAAGYAVTAEDAASAESSSPAQNAGPSEYPTSAEAALAELEEAAQLEDGAQPKTAEPAREAQLPPPPP